MADRRHLSDRQRQLQAAEAVRQLRTAARMLAEAAYDYADEPTVRRLQGAITAAALAAAVGGERKAADGKRTSDKGLSLKEG